MSVKSEVQERYLASVESKLSYKGISAWFDQDGVLFPSTSKIMVDYLANLFGLNQSEQQKIHEHYINPGEWPGWANKKITLHLINVLICKEVFDIIGKKIKVVGFLDDSHKMRLKEDKIIRIGKIFDLSDEEIIRVKTNYFSSPHDWPGWVNKELTSKIINNLVRNFFITPHLHTIIGPDPQAKATLDRLYNLGLDIYYFSSRRGNPVLHDETVSAIENADFPAARGHIYTMAWDEWNGEGLEGPLKDSTMWKVVRPFLVTGNNKNLVIIDDYFSVCRAASDAGLYSILVEADYNHPASQYVNTDFKRVGDFYIQRLPPGMMRVSSLAELPFAFHIIHEQMLKGNRDPRWATGKHIPGI